MTNVETRAESEKRKLTTFEQVVCAWPLALLLVGGALGGACGGAAWALNTKIMSSALSAPVRYGLIVLTGVGAGFLYFLGIFILASVFPNLFGPR